MRNLFNVQVGLSDHTKGIGVAVAGVALGASVIEKHFTLNRKEGGVDADFSLEPNEMTMLVKECERAWQSTGRTNYGPSEKEMRSMKFRRSLYIVKDLKAGDKLTIENLKSIRPGSGLAPKYSDILVGRRVLKDTKKGTPVSWDILS